MMVKRINVDLETCLGYGNCVVEAPELFDLDEVTDKAIVLKARIEQEDIEPAERAVRSCPAMAITLVSAE